MSCLNPFRHDIAFYKYKGKILVKITAYPSERPHCQDEHASLRYILIGPEQTKHQDSLVCFFAVDPTCYALINRLLFRSFPLELSACFGSTRILSVLARFTHEVVMLFFVSLRQGSGKAEHWETGERVKEGSDDQSCGRK